jgi:hypothetical protein
VFGIRPEGGGKPVEITVASGEHLHLGGVIGSRTGASALSESLSRKEVAGTIGGLFDAPTGKSRVRWIPQQKRATTKRKART